MLKLLQTTHVLCLVFIWFANACYAENLEKFQQRLTGLEARDKIEAIIGYMNEYAFFKPDESLQLGLQAIELLDSAPNSDQLSRVLRRLAWVHINKANYKIAEKYAVQARNEALNAGNIENQIQAIFTSVVVSQRQKDFKEAKTLLEEVTELAQNNNQKNHLAYAYRLTGQQYLVLLRYGEALKYFLQSLTLYEALYSRDNMARVHSNLASTYRRMNMYEKVLSHKRQALELTLETNNKKRLSIVYSNFATYLDEVGEHESAIDMHYKSLNIKQEMDYVQGMVHTYNRLGYLYHTTNRFEESERALMTAIELKKRLSRPDQGLSTYLDLGRLYVKMGKYDQAETLLNKSFELYQGSQWEDRVAEVYHTKGLLYLKRRQFDKAIGAYISAIKIAEEHQRDSLLIDYYRELSDVYESNGQIEQALEFTKSHIAHKDAWQEKNNQYYISALAVEFDVAEKKREILALVQQNEIKDLQLERQASKQMAAFLSLLLLFTLLSFIYFWFNKSKQLRIEKAAMRQISEANERLSLALWGSGDELWDWDLPAGKITRDNQMNNLRLPCEQVSASLETIKSCVHPDDFEQLDQCFKHHLGGKSEFYEVNYRVMTQTGDWLWVLDRGKVTSKDAQGKPTRVSGTIKDISRLKASEVALAELNETLEKRVEERTLSLKNSRDELSTALEELTSTQAVLVEAQKMASLGRLVAGVSHELNTPLGNTITASSSLMEELLGFKDKLENNKLTRSYTQQFMSLSQSSLALIESNTDRAAKLVKRFKQASVHEYITQEKTIDIKQCIESFINNQANDSAVVVNVECPDSFHAKCDAYALTKVLEDLYANAINHGLEQNAGRITIKANEEDKQVKITFTDSGKGIDQETLAHVFEPFQTTARNKGNVGLGLYMVFNLVTFVLQGSINVVSSENSGASFEIMFPACSSTC